MMTEMQKAGWALAKRYSDEQRRHRRVDRATTIAIVAIALLAYLTGIVRRASR